ncbi:DMT family transporter [Catalinimonas niigatensis]|uniref:DMT family transporter n=1 Tax=Catalinimonas niigatensis TaxID=1397264 RepID=UPI0026664A4A|nr:DMT family transporter [Catalinimonas niigatensis]WPP50079.1 DMT family transporter [Catalinimonas niigatensis]
MKNPYLLLIFATLFWAGNVVLSKAMSTDIPPITLAFWRWSMALLVISFFSWKKVIQDWDAIRKNILILLPLSLFGITVFNTLIYIALQDTSALNSLLLQSLLPVVVALMSFVFLKERLRKWQVVGILISLCGTLVLVAKGEFTTLLGTGFNRGDVWVITAVVCYASYTILLKFRPPMHPLSFLLVTFFLGTLMLLPFYLWEQTYAAPIQWNLPVYTTIAYLAVFPSFISYLFFNEAVRKVGASTAGLFSHLIPLFGSLMAILFLGETFYTYHAVGVALTFSGIYLVIKNKVGAKSRKQLR